jgi:hypothetical protein
MAALVSTFVARVQALNYPVVALPLSPVGDIAAQIAALYDAVNPEGRPIAVEDGPHGRRYLIVRHGDFSGKTLPLELQTQRIYPISA